MEQAAQVIARCRRLAEFTEEPGWITRTFLSPPMRDVHREVGAWMSAAGMQVRADGAGNLRGFYPGRGPSRLIIGSHLDTVPHAGAFDGILGVVMGVALVEALAGKRLGFGIEVIGFSEEEGVRFGTPFIGSLAAIAELGPEVLNRRDANGVSVSDAIRAFGLEPGTEIPDDDLEFQYLEFHIEQGPVLESLNLPLGIVGAIIGQSRLAVTFQGQANHAGTTPMHLRKDALQGAAEWAGTVERDAISVDGLVATVGRLEVLPGAGNVIAGTVHATLDVRHARDDVRQDAVKRMIGHAEQIASERGLKVSMEQRLNQSAVAMDEVLTTVLEDAVGRGAHRMNSGAGHDAMIMARRMPVAMLFLRSPGGISHHPDESVLTEDVDAALAVGMKFLKELDAH